MYRGEYQPSPEYPEPVTFLTVNAIAAPTAEEAEQRALPQLRMMARLRRNKPMTATETVEQAQQGLRDAADAEEQRIIDAMRSRWFVGEGAHVASDLTAFAERHGVDEVMLALAAGSYDAEPLDATPGRVQTLELLA